PLPRCPTQHAAACYPTRHTRSYAHSAPLNSPDHLVQRLLPCPPLHTHAETTPPDRALNSDPTCCRTGSDHTAAAHSAHQNHHTHTPTLTPQPLPICSHEACCHTRRSVVARCHTSPASPPQRLDT